MSITATVENDNIKLPPGMHVPDGTEVEIIVKMEEAPKPLPGSSGPNFLRVVLALAKEQDWPADYALNHAHYTKGEPKR